MTLRSRLLLMIGLSLAVLWAAASVWMLIDLRNEFRSALDERLAASARMVANLVAQLPQAPQASELSDPSSQPEVRRRRSSMRLRRKAWPARCACRVAVCWPGPGTARPTLTLRSPASAPGPYRERAGAATRWNRMAYALPRLTASTGARLC